MNDLTQKRCLPCEIGTPPLPIEKVKELLKATPDWLLIGDSIVKEIKFKDFEEAMNFINKVAKLAESEGHHPDIFISYNKVKLSLTTHASKGLTENDFILAAKIDALNS